MDFGTIASKMTLDISHFSKQLDLAQSQAQKLAVNNSKLFDIGDSMTKMGKSLTVGLTLPLLGIGAASIKVGNEFQAQMSRVQAIAGATGAELDKMKNQAIQLGAQTAFSAKEAAQGMENLASAGFSVNEIMGAMPGVLDLAAVSGGDVAASSEAMASSLRAFGLEATQAGHVADVFARAAADTNAETTDMAEAMKYVAPVAHSMGLSLEETAASIGIMADAGIKGSQAGTTLRGALSRIAKPTKAMTTSMEELGVSFYDATGNLIPLREQIGQLESATAGLTQEERNRHLVTLYGQESLSGMLALIDAGPEKLDKMTQSLINSDGAAAQMAATMQDNLASKIEQMFGAMESAGIIIQQILEPMLIKVVGGITSLIEAFVNMSPVGQKMIVIFAGMVAALGPLLLIVGVAITTFVKLKVAIEFLGPAFAGAMGPIGLVIGIIYALVAVFMIAYTKSETFRNAIDQLVPTLQTGLAVAIEWTVEKLKQFWEWLQKAGQAVAEFGQAIGDKMSVGWDSFMSSIGKAGTSVGEFISEGLERLVGAFDKVGGAVAIAVSVFTKVGLAMMGITGPIGLVISLIVSLVSAWMRTGEINADGLTQVFDNLTSTITSAADMISTYLPVFVQKGTEILLRLIEGMTAQIPALTAKMTEVITSIVQTLVTVLPQLIQAGTQILVSLIEGITQALPGIVQAAIAIMQGLLNAIMEALPTLLEAGLQIIMALVQALVAALPQIIDAGIQILMALIEGIIQMLPAIIDAVIQIIMALVDALIQALPQLIEAGIQIIMALIQGLIQMLPAVIEAIIQILIALVEALIAAIPQLIDAGVKLIVALVQGLIQVIPQVIAGIFQILAALIQAIIQHAPQILQAGVQLIGALISGLLQMLGSLLETAGSMLGQMIGRIGSFVGQMVQSGVELITNFISGIGSMIGSAVDKIGELGSQIISEIGTFASDMVQAGVDLVQGFINGMGSMVNSVVEKAMSLGESAVNTIKSFLGIKSPSRVLLAIGKWAGQGFANGIGNMISTVSDKAERMAGAVTSAVEGISLAVNPDEMLDSLNSSYSQAKDLVSRMNFDSSLRSAAYSVSAEPSGDKVLPKIISSSDEPSPGGTTINEGDITIGTIVVRDNSDVDKLSRALKDKDRQTLNSLGDYTTA